MLSHLELDTCPSGIDKDSLRLLVFEVDKEREFSTCTNGKIRFFCPVCSASFENASGLYQHAQTASGCLKQGRLPICLEAFKDSILQKVYSGR
jgi:hypothetical protein